MRAALLAVLVSMSAMLLPPHACTVQQAADGMVHAVPAQAAAAGLQPGAQLVVLDIWCMRWSRRICCRWA